MNNSPLGISLHIRRHIIPLGLVQWFVYAPHRPAAISHTTHSIPCIPSTLLPQPFIPIPNLFISILFEIHSISPKRVLTVSEKVGRLLPAPEPVLHYGSILAHNQLHI